MQNPATSVSGEYVPTPPAENYGLPKKGIVFMPTVDLEPKYGTFFSPP
jgi:hypothetical protein